MIPERTILGRSRACTIRLSEPEISGEHALLRWIGGWELQDLHSRNGTFVDGRRLAAGERISLAPGAEIGFGRVDGYILTDGGPPEAFAAPLEEGAAVAAQSDLLALPDPANPLVTIYRVGDAWSIEQGGEVQAIADGATIQIAGGGWRVHLPEALPQTRDIETAPLTVGALTLRFCVSRDEEYVELLALHGGRVFDLKARAHHYPLLLLARARLGDVGLPTDQQGWVHQDELLRQLRSDANRLHIDVYRIRRQLAELGIADAARIVERRPGTRQLRIGAARLEIVPLARG